MKEIELNKKAQVVDVTILDLVRYLGHAKNRNSLLCLQQKLNMFATSCCSQLLWVKH